MGVAAALGTVDAIKIEQNAATGTSDISFLSEDAATTGQSDIAMMSAGITGSDLTSIIGEESSSDAAETSTNEAVPATETADAEVDPADIEVNVAEEAPSVESAAAAAEPATEIESETAGFAVDFSDLADVGDSLELITPEESPEVEAISTALFDLSEAEMS